MSGTKQRESGGDSSVLELSQRIDEACDRFEAAWKAGQKPRIEEYLSAVPESRRGELLRHLIKLEVSYRGQRGEQPSLEEYQARFPGSRDLILTLQLVHRQHLGVQAPDAGREVQLRVRPWPQASSVALAAQLLGRDTRPSVAAIREERKQRLQEALSAMDPIDRDVLVLRHFQGLTNAEVARELGLQESAASKRYIRALRKLKEILAALPGGIEEFR
jgi:RNA polymerase sigma factor (sigma-70 family)